MDPIVLPSIFVGFLSSFVTEILKFVPQLGNSKQGKRVLALIVSVLATIIYLVYIGGVNWEDKISVAILVLISSYGTYQTFIKTIIKED